MHCALPNTPRSLNMANRLLLTLVVACILTAVLVNVNYLKEIQKVTGTSYNDDNPTVVQENCKYGVATQQKKTNANKEAHTIAGLNCDKHGGPSEEVAAEMVYWRDLPIDAGYKSPFANAGPSPKYLTFEPDEGGWNNIRMSMETATAFAAAMGRILVMPPTQGIYLLNKDDNKTNNKFTFHDFFHFDSLEREHQAIEIISFEEFLEREAMTGHLRDKETGQVSFPPENRTDWSSTKKARDNPLWPWMRTVATNPKWFFDDCIVTFANSTGPGDYQRMREYFKQTQDSIPAQKRIASYTDNPTPVDASPGARLRELLGSRKDVCVYDDILQNSRVFHLMGDNASGARLLVHFYLFLFFEDWRQDLWTKRFVRDHLRYIDEIQCAAARVVAAMRDKAKHHGNEEGLFDTFHIRRGDFQYKSTRVSADVIFENTRDVLVENSTIFIATDEKDMTFFDPLRQHYHIYFLHDFKDLIQDLNKNYYGMLDQRIASRGRTFIGAYYSTFTGYINRMRGYHSQNDKLPGHEKGILNSYYYIESKHKLEVRHYASVKRPMWAREFPVGWRDIEHGIEPACG